MPTIRITRQTVAQRRNVRVGDVLDVSEAEARQLIGARKAELSPAGAAAPALASPPVKTTKTTTPRKAKP
jgi:hypothetical protein